MQRRHPPVRYAFQPRHVYCIRRAHGLISLHDQRRARGLLSLSSHIQVAISRTSSSGDTGSRSCAGDTRWRNRGRETTGWGTPALPPGARDPSGSVGRSRTGTWRGTANGLTELEPKSPYQMDTDPYICSRRVCRASRSSWGRPGEGRLWPLSDDLRSHWRWAWRPGAEGRAPVR